MCFASVAYRFCRLGDSLVLRTLKPVEDAIQTSTGFLKKWSKAEQARRAGGIASEPFEFLAGRPVRFQLGGAGGSRFLGMYPSPVL